MRYLPVLVLLPLLAACGRGEVSSGASDITGVMPDLSFRMVRASDGAPVTADNYRGKAVLLYFGYTHCPDECPTTLANLTKALEGLGARARNVRVLFVTVDPQRDTLPLLKAYASSFGPQIDALRGSEDEIARLARRYRVLYRVAPASEEKDTEVMHSDSTFFFDGSSRARLVIIRTDNTKTIAADIQRLFRS